MEVIAEERNTKLDKIIFSSDENFTPLDFEPSGIPYMISPIPGTEIDSHTVEFTWDFNDSLHDVFEINITVGKDPAPRQFNDTGDIYRTYHHQHPDRKELLVREVPLDGAPIYVTFYYKHNESSTIQQPIEYIYQTTNSGTKPSDFEPSVDPPVLQVPVPNTELSARTLDFDWDPVTDAVWYVLAITQTQALLDNLKWGGADRIVLHFDSGTTFADDVQYLPINGEELYVRLWYAVQEGAELVWKYEDHTYSTSYDQRLMTSIEQGPAIDEFEFTWNAGLIPGSGSYSLGLARTPEKLRWQLYFDECEYGDLYDPCIVGQTVPLTMPNISNDDIPFYARIWYFAAGEWWWEDYRYPDQTPINILAQEPDCTLGLLFDETTANSLDACWSNDGVVTNEVVRQGASYVLDGNGAYMTGKVPLEMKGESVSVFARVNIDMNNWDGWANIVGVPYDDGPNWDHPHYSWGFLRHSNTDDEGYWVQTTTTGGKQSRTTVAGYFEEGDHSYGVVRGGSSVTFYKDGIQFGSPQTVSDGPTEGGYKWVAGSRSNYSEGEFMAGETEEIGVFSKAVTASEMMNFHTYGLNGVPPPSGTDPDCVLGLFFDEPSGQALNACGSNNGELKGDTTQLGSSYGFDGNGDYLLGEAPLTITGEKLSIFARLDVDTNNWDSWANVVGAPYDSGPSWDFPHYSWGFLRHSNSVDRGYWVQTTAGTDKGWVATLDGYFQSGDHTYGVVRDGTSVTFYKDGVQFGPTQSIVAGSLEGGHNWIVGSRSDYSEGEHMAGEAMELGVFTRAMTAMEMLDFHQNGLNVNAGGGLNVTITATPTIGDAPLQVDFTSTVSGAQGGSGEFLEQGGSVIIEAENYHASDGRTDPGGLVWNEASDGTYAGYTGAGYVETPDLGKPVAGWSDGCELSYDNQFDTPGTYTVWLKRLATGGANNSGWIGVDGTQVGGDDNASGNYNQWIWKSEWTITVGSGVSTVELRRREDGYRVDRIYLSKNGDDPNVTEPGAESPQAGGVTYAWDFGDTGTSSEANPTHTYTGAGNYTACLEVDDGNTPATDCAPITVNSP